MIVKISGTITSALQKRSGVSQTGNSWAVQEFVMTTNENETICFEAFGEENIAKFGIGVKCSLNCAINCREWNGKYFTSLRYIPNANTQPTNQPTTQAAPQPTQSPQYSFAQPQNSSPFTQGNDSDLVF